MIRKKWAITGLILLLIFSLAGAFVGNEISNTLKIDYKSKKTPQPSKPKTVSYERTTPTIEPLSGIIVPKNAMDNNIYKKPIRTLVNSIEEITGEEPKIIEYGTQKTPPGRIITIGNQKNNPLVPENINLSSNFSSESFAIKNYTENKRKILAIIGGSPLADAYGIYWITNKLKTGVKPQNENLFSWNYTSTPKISIRLDGGAGSLREVISENTDKVIDQEEFEKVENQWKDKVDLLTQFGYNWIRGPGFLEFINFDQAENGYAVYGPDSPYRKRHEVLREKFEELFEYADNMGLKVLLSTDMVFLSSPLENYFQERFGGLKVNNPEFWKVYRKGIKELFQEMPAVDGLRIRIGETGHAFNIPGWDYYGKLAVTDSSSTEEMLTGFLPVFENHNKKLFFRTWSVGVGDIGNLHTNPKTYQKVLGNVHSPNLIISTKYTKGDFYSYLPFNPTLETGTRARMVELQSEREFEGFGEYPNYVGPLYKTALNYALENTNTIAMWLWGGPGYMGEPAENETQLYNKINFYVTSKLAWNPDANTADLAADYIARTFGKNTTVIENMTEMLLTSREVVRDGLYVKGFATKDVDAFGLKFVPTMMWIFEWNRVCGTTSTLSGIYYTINDNPENAIEDGFSALEKVRRMKKQVTGLENKVEKNEKLYGKMISSLEYEESIYTTLAHYRKFFIKYYHWLNEGNSKSFKEWNNALENFETEKENHYATYGKPAKPTSYAPHKLQTSYYFKEAEAFADRAKNTTSSIWAARLLLIGLICTFLIGSGPIQKRTSDFPGKNGFKALWKGTVTPWNMDEVENNAKSSLLLLALLLISVIGGFAIFSLFSAPYTTMGIAGALVISLTSLILLYNWKKTSKITSTLGTFSPIILIMMFLLGIISLRGPYLFWYYLWSNTSFKILLGIIMTGLLGWTGYGIIANSKTNLETNLGSGIGKYLILLGILIAFSGGMIGLFGLESTVWVMDKELLFLPFALHDILNITTYLGIPQSLPWTILKFGGITILIGTILSTIRWLWSKK